MAFVFVRAVAVSMLTTMSYLCIGFGAAFAFLVAGTVQLVYLVLFSYAFFFKVLTGLIITIGAIAKLFVFMQVTARVDWKALFAPKSPSLSEPQPDAV